jgi:hypothetical protein
MCNAPQEHEQAPVRRYLDGRQRTVATSYGFVYNGLASMTGCELQMACYDLKSDFGFNGCLRLQCLTSMSATSYNVASASMADCGFNVLTSMPGYKLQKGLHFKG